MKENESREGSVPGGYKVVLCLGEADHPRHRHPSLDVLEAPTQVRAPDRDQDAPFQGPSLGQDLSGGAEAHFLTDNLHLQHTAMTRDASQ